MYAPLRVRKNIYCLRNTISRCQRKTFPIVNCMINLQAIISSRSVHQIRFRPGPVECAYDAARLEMHDVIFPFEMFKKFHEFLQIFLDHF